MRHRIFLLLLAPLVALPTDVGARSIPVPGIVAVPLQMATRGFVGRRAAHRTRHHRKAAVVRRHNHVAARPARHRAAETTGIGVAGGQGAAAEASERVHAAGARQGGSATAVQAPAWVGSLYWPSASDDLFDYTLRPPSTGERFWSHGARDLLAAIFVRSEDKPGSSEKCGGQPGDGGWRDPLVQAVQPTEAQRRALDDLQSAVTAARKGIDGTCPAADAPVTPTGRLDAMTDRLWAMRQATIIVRAPLESFFTALTEEQRARVAGSGEREAGAAIAMACADPASAQVPWPNEEIERRVRPASEQRESLQALQMTVQGMGQFLMASCPAEPPVTPLKRLDAAEKRLNAMLYAARMTGPALHGFYDSLSPEQKAAFDTLKPQPRTPGAPAMARGTR
ncbi:MAG: Spy/CpxP family protein refolding chaperone [Xanthobacteraceae bacterium]